MQVVQADVGAFSSAERKYFKSSAALEVRKQLKGTEYWNGTELTIYGIAFNATLSNVLEWLQGMGSAAAIEEVFGCVVIRFKEGGLAFYDPSLKAGFIRSSTDWSALALITTAQFRLSFSGLASMVAVLKGGFPVHSCGIANGKSVFAFAGGGGIGKTKTAFVADNLGYSLLNDDLNFLFSDRIEAYDRPAAIYQSHKVLFGLPGGARVFRRSIAMRALLRFSRLLGYRPGFQFEYELRESREVFEKVCLIFGLENDVNAKIFACFPREGAGISNFNVSHADGVAHIINTSLKEWCSIYDLFFAVAVERHGTIKNAFEYFEALFDAKNIAVGGVSIGRHCTLSELRDFLNGLS